MTALQKARELDARDDPVGAITAYEQAIANEDVGFDVFLDLAILYFKCADFGYASAHHLPQEIEEKSHSRAKELLREAEHRFGASPEVSFWQRYIDFVVLAEPHFEEEARGIANQGGVDVYIYLFSTAGKEYADKARDLLKSVAAGRTARERYIKGVLEGRV